MKDALPPASYHNPSARDRQKYASGTTIVRRAALVLLPLGAALLAICSLVAAGSLDVVGRWPLVGWASCHRTGGQGDVGQHGSSNDWVKAERDVAWWGLLANIGPAAGASPGLVVASPSRAHPDYFYSWSRDSALTFATIFDRFVPYANGSVYAHADLALEPLLREYVDSQAALQLVTTPSGGLLDGGLGEPKFEVNGSAFTGSWGRPQRDGPPLRALVATRYAQFLLRRGDPLDVDYVRSKLYNPAKLIAPSSIIKSDLEYSAHNWQKTSFDLWEEIDGHHFFTLLATYRALNSGAVLALAMNDPLAAAFYLDQAGQIAAKLDDFWLADEGFITATLDAASFGRSGVDAAVLLAVLHAGGKAGEPWSVVDERVLATLVKYVDAFRGDLYAVNEGGRGRKEWRGAVAVGRYAEDVYDGDGKSAGNPWFLTTFAVAELQYRVAIHSLTTGKIAVSAVSLPFWQSFDPSLAPGDVLEAPGARFNDLLRNLTSNAQGFLLVGKTFAGPGGTLTEQFSRLDGSPTGARNLTWSYSAFVDATNARREVHQLRRRSAA